MKSIYTCKTLKILSYLAFVKTIGHKSNTKLSYLGSIRYQTNTAQKMLSTIVNIQPKDSGGGGGETRETVVYRLADDMLEKLPEDYIPHEVRARANCV